MHITYKRMDLRVARVRFIVPYIIKAENPFYGHVRRVINGYQFFFVHARRVKERPHKKMFAPAAANAV